MSTSLQTLLDQTLRRARRERLWQPGPATRSVDLRDEALRALLRHRPPFLLLDAVTALDPEVRGITGQRRIDEADPVFAGHFPGRPVYPGALQVEMLAQLAACYRPALLGLPPEPLMVTGMRATFFQPVLPGDELTLVGLQVGEHDGLFERGVGQVWRGDTLCAIALVEGVHEA